jgi:hypothetical protein
MKKSVFDFNPILSNSVVLYIFLFMAVIQMFFFLNTKDFQSLVIFIILGLVISYFNKNMIIILCLSLVVTNIIKYGVKGVRISEGFQDSEELSEEDKEIADSSVKNLDKPKSKKAVIKKKDEVKKSNDLETNDDITKLEKDKNQLVELKSEFPEFKEIQTEIIQGIDKISPLLKKAESYMQKYENFKNSKEGFIKDVLKKDKK